jgi:peptidyl-prolyl cis-trans isomerase C
MSIQTRNFALAVAIIIFGAHIPVWAQSLQKTDEVQEEDVFAIVNGSNITGRDVSLAAESMRNELENLPEQYRLVVLINVLINQHLFANAAKDAGVEQDTRYEERLAYHTQKSLRDTYVETVLAGQITESNIKKRYEAEVEKLPKSEEVWASHVLVGTEAEANVIFKLATGERDFAELAREHSTGPSAENGGDLDYFTAEQMVEEFSNAAFALKIGGISDPVKTKFGWHVIKLTDRRLRPPPPL